MHMATKAKPRKPRQRKKPDNGKQEQPTQVTPVMPMQQQPPTPEEQQLVQELIQGARTSDSEVVNYKLDQMREVMAQREVLMNNIRQGEQQLAAMRQQVVMLDGQQNQCIQDILVWNEKSNGKQKQQPEATP
jgi:hypothetical protein